MAKRREIVLGLAEAEEGLADATSILTGLSELMDDHAAKVVEVVEKASGITVWGQDGIATHLADQGLVLVATREDVLARLKKVQVETLAALQVKLARPRRQEPERVVTHASEPSRTDDAERWLRERLSELAVPMPDAPACPLGDVIEQANALTQMLRGLCAFADEGSAVPAEGWSTALQPALKFAKHIQAQRPGHVVSPMLDRLVAHLAGLVSVAEEHGAKALIASDDEQIILERFTRPSDGWAEMMLEALNLAIEVEHTINQVAADGPESECA